MLLGEVLVHAGQTDLVPLVVAGGDVEQLDLHGVFLEDGDKAPEGFNVALVERRGEGYAATLAEIAVGDMLRDGQERRLGLLDHLARDATDQVDILLILAARSHHHERGAILLGVFQDLLLGHAFLEDVVVLHPGPLAAFHLAIDQRAHVFNVGLDALIDGVDGLVAGRSGHDRITRGEG